MRAALSFIAWAAGIIAGLYVLVCALLYWRQESSIFFPGPNNPQLKQRWADQRVELNVDGATLEGWWASNPQATTSAVIIYFGGNAEDVLYTAGLASHLDAKRTLVMNYRGYGGSTGRPGQQSLYADALAIYDYVIAQGEQPRHVVLMGRSLGSGMATMLAANREVAGVVLITPFDSLVDVAAGHYPVFPVRLLLRHPFPSKDWAAKTTSPALILAAERDFVVPPVHAQRLSQHWAGPQSLHMLADVGHNDIESNPDYYTLINRFLASLPQ